MNEQMTDFSFYSKCPNFYGNYGFYGFVIMMMRKKYRIKDAHSTNVFGLQYSLHPLNGDFICRYIQLPPLLVLGPLSSSTQPTGLGQGTDMAMVEA